MACWKGKLLPVPCSPLALPTPANACHPLGTCPLQGLPVDEVSRQRLNRSLLELLEEKQIALAVLGPR